MAYLLLSPSILLTLIVVTLLSIVNSSATELLAVIWPCLIIALVGEILWLRYRQQRKQQQEHQLAMALDQRLQERERELACCQLLLRVQQEATPDGVVAFDDQHLVISCNRVFRRQWQIPDALMAYGRYDLLWECIQAQTVDAPGLQRLDAETRHDLTIEVRDEIRSQDGRIMERYSQGLCDASGRYHGRIWFYRDVTVARHTETHLRQLANVDTLTGTSNRGAFLRSSRARLSAMAQTQDIAALLVVDLDHFKAVNDHWGHLGGDAVLENFAKTVQAVLQDQDLFGRLGGEEFAVFISHADSDEALAVAERIRQAVQNKPTDWEGHRLAVTISIGVSLYHAGDSITDLLRRADAALYRAKHNGRNRVELAETFSQPC